MHAPRRPSRVGPIGRLSAAAVTASLVFGAFAVQTATPAGAATAVQPSTLEVTASYLYDGSDDVAGDGFCKTIAGVCTLRAAVEEAMAWDGCTTVALRGRPAAYKLTGGDLYIHGCVRVEGSANVPSGNASVIDGNGGLVFDVDPGAHLELHGLTVQNGHGHSAGAILNRAGTAKTASSPAVRAGSVEITSSWLKGNRADDNGGAIVNGGALLMSETTLSGNSAGSFGGAIYNCGQAYIENSTFSGNAALNQGGALFNGAGNNTCDPPSDPDTGKLGEAAWVGLSNTTITQNRATEHDPVTGRGKGGGIYNAELSDPTEPKVPKVVLLNTIVAGNSGRLPGWDCSGTLELWGHNLVGRGAGCTTEAKADPGTEQVGSPAIDPRLSALADNGGPAPTHALKPASPAIDAGRPGTAGEYACREIDQRGLARPQDGPKGGVFDEKPVCDVGAYEYGSPKIAVLDAKVTEADTNTTKSFPVSLSYPHVEPVTVVYGTRDGTAKAGSDYVAKTGSVTFAPGQRSKFISITVIGGNTKEVTETFKVNLSSPTKGRIGDGQAIGTIVDDD